MAGRVFIQGGGEGLKINSPEKKISAPFDVTSGEVFYSLNDHKITSCEELSIVKTIQSSCSFCGFSNNKEIVILSIGTGNSPYLNLFAVKDGSVIELQNSNINLTATVYTCVCVSHNGYIYLFVGYFTSPYINCYYSNQYGVFTKMPNPVVVPTTLPNKSAYIIYNKNLYFIAAGSNSSSGGTKLNIYKLTSYNVLTNIYASPSTISGYSYNDIDSIVFNDEAFIVGVGTITNFIEIYKIENDRLVKQTNPNILPSARVAGARFYIYKNELYIIYSCSIGTEFMGVYKLLNGQFIKQYNLIDILPSINVYGNKIINYKSLKFMFISFSSSPYIQAYKLNEGIWQKQVDLGITVSRFPNDWDVVTNGDYMYLTCSYSNSPYLAWFKLKLTASGEIFQLEPVSNADTVENYKVLIAKNTVQKGSETKVIEINLTQ